MLIFHSNGEDLGLASIYALYLNANLKMNVVVPEFPGYGLSQGGPSNISPNAETVTDDMFAVFNYFTKGGDDALFKVEDVLVLGRSIGCGPALEIAAYTSQVLNRKLYALILISPFTSLSNLIADMFGYFPSFLVKNRYNNEHAITLINCPCMLIHGKLDRMVSY